MSEKSNSKDVFQREINLCQDFKYYEDTDDVKISFNVSSSEMTIWVNFSNSWNIERGTKTFNELLKCWKLILVGYQPWQMKQYPAAE